MPVSHLATWPTVDLDLALAEVAIEADTGRYGESLTEAMNPGADPADYSTGYRYVAHGPRMNWAEYAAWMAEEEHRKQLPEGERMPAGLSWTVTKETYTPIPEGEAVEIQLEQAAYGSTSAEPRADAADKSGDDSGAENDPA